jgi:hypothetical protein
VTSGHALEEWLHEYGRAWEKGDADLVVALFTADATYQVTPFREPMVGRAAIHDYWSQVPKNQGDITFGYDVWSTEPAVAHWWARYNAVRTDRWTRLDGVFLLEFDETGLCTSLREWWHADPEPSF